MSTLFIFIVIIFSISFVRDILFYSWLWQIKEYRIDRMLSYLGESQETKNIGIRILILFILAFLLIAFHGLFIFYIIAIFYSFSAIIALKEIKQRSLKRPRFTFKIICIFLIFALAVLLLGLSFLNTGEGLLIFFFLSLSILIPAIMAFSVLLINPVFNLQKKKIIRNASIKMSRLKRVKTIGITGSYGKTSTKEFLYRILSDKFKVAKTEGNNNTNIGVAYTVLNKVSDDFDYFICEMGAYKIGEIEEMCDMVKPDTGIITGINDQHIELFGNIENTYKAKFELIESLSETGKAVINEKLKGYFEKSHFKTKNVNYFSIADANDIKIHGDGVEFKYKGNMLEVKLLGRHYIGNLIAAIKIAEMSGMTSEEIKNAIAKIAPDEFMMRKLNGINGSIFIDDSYSANPDGVLAALDYVSEAYDKYRKIIVFPGFIELGSKSEKAHKDIFHRISNVCDIAIILNKKYSKFNLENKCKFIFENEYARAADKLRKELDKNTIVLFESRGAGAVMKSLISS